MTGIFEPAPSTKTNSSKTTKQLTRRRMLLQSGVGIAGLTGAIAAGNAQANTQKPVTPKTGTDPKGKFADKVVLITGATSGIGEATARAFAKEGAIIHFCGRREALGEKVAQEINSQGGRASYQKVDVRQEEDVKSFINTCVQKYGRIDIAFNNAGIESSPNAIAEQSLDDWMNVINTNATGVFLSMKYELPVMLRQKGGIIVNNASVSGHVGFGTISPYSASKHAIMSLTKVAALEYSDKNIRVNSVSPGAVDTPMLRRALAAWKTDFEAVSQEYPLKRIVKSEEIARTVMWLSSDDASCIVGMDVDATGGYLTK
jgi:NAD(P)-dependent dehydrogenase (short-subunit alcohol dehydrogenase family)